MSGGAIMINMRNLIVTKEEKKALLKAMGLIWD